MTDEPKGAATAERLTSAEFWDSSYQGRGAAPFDDKNWRDLVSIQLVRLLEPFVAERNSICEVGGGDGKIAAYFAGRYPGGNFSIIDFSPAGCDLARRRAEREKVSLRVYQEDFFSPPPELLHRFDLVISLGVVEHFARLPDVLAAKGRLLDHKGAMFTLIPNFSSPIYAYLCKHWSQSVFEDHVPHDMHSFLSGHKEAGFLPVDYGYLGAVGFGMLSMAMSGPESKTWLDRQAYLLLSRLSKAIHFVEYRTTSFPTTKAFSPFMYVVSVKAT